jgi:hypothetical protein
MKQKKHRPIVSRTIYDFKRSPMSTQHPPSGFEEKKEQKIVPLLIKYAGIAAAFSRFL